VLFDTDVIIWHLRGNSHAGRSIQNTDSRAISAITYMEVVRGLRNKEEARHWQAFLKNLEFQILPVEERISAKAMFWMDEFSLSHTLQIPDALIAATAEINGLILMTGNVSDYRFLPGLNLKAFRAQ